MKNHGINGLKLPYALLGMGFLSVLMVSMDLLRAGCLGPVPPADLCGAGAAAHGSDMAQTLVDGMEVPSTKDLEA